jgi:hypothetical protein
VATCRHLWLDRQAVVAVTSASRRPRRYHCAHADTKWGVEAPHVYRLIYRLTVNVRSKQSDAPDVMTYADGPDSLQLSIIEWT